MGDQIENDPLESEEFYNLMQTYRHTCVGAQAEVVAVFEDIKTFIRNNFEVRA